jgi:hypothetical protein
MHQHRAPQQSGGLRILYLIYLLYFLYFRYFFGLDSGGTNPFNR